MRTRGGKERAAECNLLLARSIKGLISELGNHSVRIYLLFSPSILSRAAAAKAAPQTLWILMLRVPAAHHRHSGPSRTALAADFNPDTHLCLRST